MKRLHIHLPEQLIERIKQEMNRTGITLAEVLRRGVEFYLDHRETQIRQGQQN